MEAIAIRGYVQLEYAIAGGVRCRLYRRGFDNRRYVGDLGLRTVSLWRSDSIAFLNVASVGDGTATKDTSHVIQVFQRDEWSGVGHKLNKNTATIKLPTTSNVKTRYNEPPTTHRRQNLSVLPFEIFAVDSGGLKHVKDGLSKT